MTLREIKRWVPRYGIFQEPAAHEVSVRLEEHNDGTLHCILTPWACLAAVCGRETTDAQLAAALGCSFATEAEALADDNRKAPHWHDRNNDAVRSRLYDARRWDGDLVGDGALADALGVSTDRLREICWGKHKATRAQAQAARDYHGARRV